MLQLSSDTFRTFHGAAVIRDGGVPGKDLGPMPLGYTLSFGLPLREGVSDAGVWLTARMGGLTPQAAHFNQGASSGLGCGGHLRTPIKRKSSGY